MTEEVIIGHVIHILIMYLLTIYYVPGSVIDMLIGYLMTKICSKKCVVRQFLCCQSSQHSYINSDGIV
jgi:flagellar biosynthesis protein FliR